MKRTLSLKYTYSVFFGASSLTGWVALAALRGVFAGVSVPTVHTYPGRLVAQIEFTATVLVSYTPLLVAVFIIG